MARTSPGPKLSGTVSSTVVQWAEGDSCRAIWSEDGEVYRARIDSVDWGKGTCEVTFTDYGNTDTARLSELLPVDKSSGKPQSEQQGERGQRQQPAQYDHGAPIRGTERLTRPQDRPVRRWAVGDPCRCIYRADGLMYGARITELAADGQTCAVVFDVYGNEQADTPISHLFAASPTPTTPSSQSRAPHDSRLPPQWAGGGGPGPGLHYGGAGAAAPPHPPRGHPSGGTPLDDSLASLLMSWYQSGFHTGYYLAQQELRRGPRY